LDEDNELWGVALWGYVAICCNMFNAKTKMADQDASRMRAECNEKTLKVQKDGQGVPLKKLENRLAKAISQLNLLGHDACLHTPA